MNDLPASVATVQKAADALGLAVTIRMMEAPTRTVAEAAAACGCPEGAIVKSLIFMGKQTGRPYLLLVSGANRVDEKAVAGPLGEPIMQGPTPGSSEPSPASPLAASADRARRPHVPYLDGDLLQYETVWAAAGTPHAVFAVDPKALRDATGATVIAMQPG